MKDLERHLALWSRPSAPWTPGQRSEPGHRPGRGASGGTWRPAPPAGGRCPRMGWEQRLKRKKYIFQGQKDNDQPQQCLTVKWNNFDKVVQQLLNLFIPVPLML